MRLDDLVASGGKSVPARLPLNIPGQRQQGILSCALSYQQEDRKTAATSTKSAAAEDDDLAGTLSLALLVNWDAEEAERVANDAAKDLERQRVAALQEKERRAIEAARLRMEAVHGRRPSSSSTTPAEAVALVPSRLTHLSGEDQYSGVDADTGLPWRLDEDGYRRFFLGFPPDR